MPAKTQPARGMRDFLPADVRRREYVIRVIKEVYERYGFEPLETPAVENIETLLGKYGEEGNQLIFKILKRGEHEKTGEADLALRYDLTVPLARVVAEYGERLPKFFKRYQIQPVWRADRPARGRFREFYQCDVDVHRHALRSCRSGNHAPRRATCSDALGFYNFTIRLNHRQVLAGVLEAAGVDGGQARRGARRARQARQDRARGRRAASSRRAVSTRRPARGCSTSSRSCPNWNTPPSSSPTATARPRCRRPQPTTTRRSAASSSSSVITTRARAASTNLRQIVEYAADVRRRRQDQDRPEPRARALLLHGRDHGDQRARPRGEPRRRRALRQPRRHVLRAKTSRRAASLSGLSASSS